MANLPNFQSVSKACKRLDSSNTRFYLELSKSLLPPLIAIGARKKAVLEHEISAIIAARANGANDAQIKILVKKLVNERVVLLNGRTI